MFPPEWNFRTQFTARFQVVKYAPFCSILPWRELWHMRNAVTDCPVETTLAVIAGRWKMVILYHLFDGTLRFSELQRAMPGVTQKMLTQQLRELERDGVVRRKIYPQVPPKVEYSLSPLGQSLKPALDSMCKWGSLHRSARRLRIAPGSPAA